MITIIHQEEVVHLLKSVLNTAKSYLGTQQGDGKHKDLIKKYNAVKPLPVGYPMKGTDDWCAAFVTVVGDLANASKYIGRECGAQRFVAIFKNKGIWRGLAKPAPGDIVVFDWQKNGWADHMGFVEAINGNTITTIEGNTSKCVARRNYPWNDWRIAGYARPKYPSANPKPNKTIHDIASEVIQGKWGNGEERVIKLKKAGYDARTIQKEVNAILKEKGNQKLNEIVAREVIQGKWGNGQNRKSQLEKAGYDYFVIQKIVNKLI